MTESSQRPANWAVATVGDICPSTQYGYTASASSIQCGPRFLRITDIQEGAVNWDGVPYCEMQERDVEKYAVKSGDLLVARTGGTVGKSFLISSVPEPTVFASYLIRLSPGASVEPRYLYYFFQSAAYWRQIGLKKGGLLGNVNATTLTSIELPICPKPEQQRIASKLDELFSRIEEGKRALGRVQKLVEYYRQSVLKAAVTGELTRKWRTQRESRLKSGEALLQHILKARREAWETAELDKMKSKGLEPANDSWRRKYQEPLPPNAADLPKLPEGWVWCSLNQLLLKIEAGRSFTCEGRPPEEGEFGVVKVSAVTWGTYDEMESKTITDDSRIESSYLIKEGDFLFSRANTIELVGASVIVHETKRQLLLSDKILRFVFAIDLKGWVDVVLKSHFGRSQIEALSTGNQESMRNIGQDRIGRIAVPLPSAAEIDEIVNISVNEAYRVSEALRTCTFGLKSTEALRQSVLRSAFAGLLVDQDTWDEPASDVVECIAAKHINPTKPMRGLKKKAE